MLRGLSGKTRKVRLLRSVAFLKCCSGTRGNTVDRRRSAAMEDAEMIVGPNVESFKENYCRRPKLPCVRALTLGLR